MTACFLGNPIINLALNSTRQGWLYKIYKIHFASSETISKNKSKIETCWKKRLHTEFGPERIALLPITLQHSDFLRLSFSKYFWETPLGRQAGRQTLSLFCLSNTHVSPSAMTHSKEQWQMEAWWVARMLTLGLLLWPVNTPNHLILQGAAQLNLFHT